MKPPTLNDWREFIDDYTDRKTIVGDEDFDFVKGIWRNLHQSGKALKLMAPEDTATLKQWRAIGKRVTIYRAGWKVKFSFTSNRAYAERLAGNGHAMAVCWWDKLPMPTVRTYTVAPADIIYYIGESEFEVITLPEFVTEIREAGQ